MHAESAALEGGQAEAVFYAGGPAAALLRSRFQLSRQLSHPSVFALSDGESSSLWCYSDTEVCSRQFTGESLRSGSSRTEDHQQYELVEQNLVELQRQAGHGFMRMPGTDRGVS
eukprot:g17588.t1